MCHDGVIHCNAVAVALGLEGLLEDLVAIDMGVAVACSDGEAASLVGEELAEWLCYDKHLVGRHFNGRR